jgi:hypothetical protein
LKNDPCSTRECFVHDEIEGYFMDVLREDGERSRGVERTHSKKLRDTLEKYYKEVQIIINSRQNPATGLIPASVAVTTHGDYRDAWVR